MMVQYHDYLFCILLCDFQLWTKKFNYLIHVHFVKLKQGSLRSWKILFFSLCRFNYQVLFIN